MLEFITRLEMKWKYLTLRGANQDGKNHVLVYFNSTFLIIEISFVIEKRETNEVVYPLENYSSRYCLQKLS